ncbi:MAG: ABC transporter ATP-binding protein, partial [Lachnospiraceae bacterium]|nr:ABC transporter ATP-binding protein [Lachnospiraceae bacterium]
PTSALDINHQFRLMNLISRLTRERDLTTLTTLHHLDVASKYSDSVIVLNDRGVYTQGASDSVVTREMLREVYRVESEMFTDVYGCVHAVPTKDPNDSKMYPEGSTHPKISIYFPGVLGY